MFRIRKPIRDIWFITVKHNGLAKWYKGGRHKGIDLRVRNNEYPNGIGMPIYAVADGEWSEHRYNFMMGNTVILKHKDGYESVYGHLSIMNWKPGYTTIKAGDCLGYSGSTGKICFGPHLHFEIKKDGVSLDPVKFIEAGNKLLNWARARSIMRVERGGNIKFLSKDGVVDLTQDNCWNIMSKNSWGINEQDFKDLLDLM